MDPVRLSLRPRTALNYFVRGGTVVGALAGVLAFYGTYVRPLFQYNISGLWHVSHVFEPVKGSMAPGMNIEFDFILSQENTKLTGQGRKVRTTTLNRVTRESSSLELEGYTSGAQAFVFFRESPDRRPEQAVHGVIRWYIVNRNNMTGEFDTIGGAAGHSDARRTKMRLSQS